jgi:hypothetical protein
MITDLITSVPLKLVLAINKIYAVTGMHKNAAAIKSFDKKSGYTKGG